ncbi:recombinase family protein [Psychromarinibacter halotolerans]|uniref:Recombinase family protein n=1 Tax=Psychromarinibacter halotolerans TaxID=1775175 RepID=A0ABV7GVL0_9RHOB|nr:recombinase family protein [Psychromarinibacter halotolerans]MDF0598439.1 recombinase family protein [Psychromarinibacter halotolerans]
MHFVVHFNNGTTKRPKFIRAMKTFQHKGSQFIVWMLDQLGCTLGGVLDTLQILTECGASFVSLTRSIHVMRCETRTARERVVPNLYRSVPQFAACSCAKRQSAASAASPRIRKVFVLLVFSGAAGEI